MAKYKGHMLYLEDLKTGTPSVFQVKERLLQFESNCPGNVCFW